ncbi:MAG TPA: demethoxyubiquinone hydroxylase family protein [Rhodospirillales bacterium]|jgi:ubiquinone biosynthesis monooxygenase Coq7|nr:demethoxyubiquinone hydroxylase family protein [Rhodospirillales bacterium]
MTESPPSDIPAGPRRLPGDLSREAMIRRILRVDQAGEYGAVRIYEGQLAVLGNRGVGPVIREMAEAERQHLETFNTLLPQRRVRPTLLHPLWHVAGFALGAGTALLGSRAAMACTAAVEEVIDDHYAKQVAALGDDEPELRDLCERYRQDEADHRATSLDHGAEQAPAYRVLTGAIKAGSRAAIWLSERI